MTATRLITEPECCNTPMVHNSYTGEWECADAYLALVDEGVIGDYGDLRSEAVENGCACSNCRAWRALYVHWQESRRPDGWD
jgi:hypothetical protein